MRLHLDHVSDGDLLELYHESFRLREEAFDQDASKWVIYARVLRHDEIVQALAERGLLARHRPPRAAARHAKPTGSRGRG
jgi:hypothetical protein